MPNTRAQRSDVIAFIIIGIVIALLGGVAALDRHWNLGLIAPRAEPPPQPAAFPSPTPTSAPAWYALYFTTPETTADLPHPSGGIPDQISASFATAQRSLDVAIYEFDLQPLAESLIQAQNRGVRVRLVTDSDSLAAPALQSLAAAGLAITPDERGATMHDKFVVIDEVSVWTGSMNFTASDAYRNNNSMLWVHSAPLAQNYAREFDEMFTRRAFGPTSPADTPHPQITVGGASLENYFAPEDRVATRVLAQLEAAQRSVYFMAFSFTREDFATALIARAQAGVTVQGVFETRQIAAGGDRAWNLLTGAGLAARQDGNPYNLHSKVFIIDLQTVVLGSFNFSRNADENNDENVLIIHDPTIAAAYYTEWLKAWAQAEGVK
jgi:phosphatidylserine/phosphatidylglycerophosphate/cardiolipin synthase-like enzyme